MSEQGNTKDSKCDSDTNKVTGISFVLPDFPEFRIVLNLSKVFEHMAKKTEEDRKLEEIFTVFHTSGQPG